MRHIASEVFRQISIIESGSRVAQQTRGFDEDKSDTFKLRSKEDAPDYRYMPDPNLPPLLLTAVRPTTICLDQESTHALAYLLLSARNS
jgi:Asp-tRNA(Asn)/Glu-tRNA(Gln) amidotransferase B subunit